MSEVLRLHHASVPMPPGGNDRARAYYGEALGMEEVTPPSTLDRERLVWFNAGPHGCEIHVFTQEGFDRNKPGQHVCIEVEDIEGWRQRLIDHNAEVSDTIEIHNRPRFFSQDPFGNQLEFTQILGHYDDQPQVVQATSEA